VKIIPISSVNANEDKNTCAQCGGECCKGVPGVYHPDDLFDSMTDLEIKNKIISMLKSGNTVVTRREVVNEDIGYPYAAKTIAVNVLSARAVQGSNRSWFQHDNIGRCINLNDSGCVLSSIDRPRECRTLVPTQWWVTKSPCKQESSFDSDDLTNEWTIYEEIIREAEDQLRSH
jgi:Fe-S-cluster containining protein